MALLIALIYQDHLEMIGCLMKCLFKLKSELPQNGEPLLFPSQWRVCLGWKHRDIQDDWPRPVFVKGRCFLSKREMARPAIEPKPTILPTRSNLIKSWWSSWNYIFFYHTLHYYVRPWMAWLVLLFSQHGDARSRNFLVSGYIFCQPTTLCQEGEK